MIRIPHATVRRPVQRWMAAALAVTLVVLTVAAVLGSWRQAAIVRTVAADSTRTDGYQEAVYLATLEESLLQGALFEPDGEERDEIVLAGRRTLAALHALPATDTGRADRHRALAAKQESLRPAVERYLARLDDGDAEAAHEILEEEIEPVADGLRAGLIVEQRRQVQAYLDGLDRAERESGLLRYGTLLIFLLGLVVLGAVGWSNRQHRRVVERMAAHDALTGLPNRVAFHHAAERALAGAGATPRVTALMLDLDGFKEVNDNLGHHAGDLLLVEVGRRLRAAVRGTDLVARLGGDEFAVLLVDDDPAVGENAAARISGTFNDPFVVDGITLDIEVSIGIVTAGPDDDSAALMRFADIAMYTAKEHRLGWTRFNPGQAHETASRLTLLGDLRRALDTDDEIRLHYQPKISVPSGAVTGAEALARWEHPTRGPVGPAEFIPVLEGTSLIHRFTTRVLRLALAQTRRWLDEGHRVPVAVNVSTRSLLDSTFPDQVAEELRAAGVSGDLLCIEITENTVMADPDRAIDDFGTGYSSMAYLKILPVDEIKVDRSFVRDMAVDHGNRVLVESTVDLGHNLGLVVVAEGVEDGPTVTALQDLGCDVAQGYHYAKPLAADDFTAFLAQRPVTAGH